MPQTEEQRKASFQAAGLTPEQQTAVISGTSLTPQTPINLPPAPDNSIQYNGAMVGVQGTIDAIHKSMAALQAEQTAAAAKKPEAQSDFSAMLQQYLGPQTPPPSLEAQYNSMYAASPIAANQTQANTDAAAVQAAQDQYNVTNAQLQGLNYQYSTLIPNQVQQDYAERSNVTRGSIANDQMARQRQKLLEIAPIQFQALIQQAAVANAQGKAALSQSILQQSQNHLDKIFQIHSQDALAQYEYKNKQIEAVYNFATKQEQNRLDDLRTKNANDFTLKRDAISYAQDLAKSAMDNARALGRSAIGSAMDSGQSALAGKIMALDPASPTYSSDLAKLAGQITQNPLDVALKQAQINAANRSNRPSDSAPTVKSINGVDMQWNGAKWESIGGGGGGAPQQLANAKANVDLIGGLATNSYLGSAVGPNVFSRLSPTSFFTGGKSNFIAGVQQISDQLKLDKLIQSKAQGATFGALSDNELRVIASAATKIGTWTVKDKEGNVTGYNTNEASFRQELDKINNFAKLDYIIKGGDPADVGAKIMPDGTVWTTNSDGSYTQIK